jgi:hypothetical protein
MKKIILLIVSHHIAVAVIGFMAGIYYLPILTAPPAPEASAVAAAAEGTRYSGEFRRDLADSDAFHWGKGTVFVGDDTITLKGSVAPGPDYKLYLATEFIETEEKFLRVKADLVRIGDVKTFDNFIVEVPPGIDVGAFNTVVVWCESFSEFITAAKYR